MRLCDRESAKLEAREEYAMKTLASLFETLCSLFPWNNRDGYRRVDIAYDQCQRDAYVDDLVLMRDKAEREETFAH